MTEDDVVATYTHLSDLTSRIRIHFDQPTADIAALAEDTLALATRDGGVRCWHEGQLEKLVAALNSHRRKREQNPNSTMWLLLAVHDIAGLLEPMERVAEDLREPADEKRVEALLAEIRTWRSWP